MTKKANFLPESAKVPSVLSAFAEVFYTTKFMKRREYLCIRSNFSKKPIHIHFIGIGGISMSGLAEILLEEGFTVSGSDAKESPLTKKAGI